MNHIVNNPDAPVENDGSRATQLAIASRAAQLGQALHRFIHDVPMPVDVATGRPLFTDQSETDVSDSLIGAEMALHSITGVIMADLGISPEGVIGGGAAPGNGNAQAPKVSAPR